MARSALFISARKCVAIKYWLLKDEGPIGTRGEVLLPASTPLSRCRTAASSDFKRTRAKPRQVACRSPCHQRTDGMDDDDPPPLSHRERKRAQSGGEASAWLWCGNLKWGLIQILGRHGAVPPTGRATHQMSCHARARDAMGSMSGVLME